MRGHQTRFGGGGRVVALLMVLLVGTVSWAGAASTATSALMTALMQDPPSPAVPGGGGGSPPPAQSRIRTRSAPVVQENVDRAIAAAVGGTGGGGTGDGGAGGGGFQAGGAAVSVPVEQLFTNTVSTDVFKAMSSDETVVTVTVTNPRVVITPVGPGTATVTVSAQRPGGAAAIRTRFDVTVGAPGVPALPLVATGLLGMILFGAGLYRRWRRP